MPLHMHAPSRTGARQVPLSAAEQTARVQLAACYRIFHLLGWTELIFNHITLRVPGPERIFLINPFGLHYSEVTASNLVAVDIDGHPVRETPHPINRAGFVTHSALHAHQDGAHCVMHTHTTNGIAVACLKAGLSHDSFYGAQLHGAVAYHDFEGITVNPDEQQRLLADVGSRKAVILRNHGLLSWGRDIPEAFMWLWTLQRACDVQVSAAAAGAMNPVAEQALAQCSRESGPGERTVRELVYASLVRRVDAIDDSYRL